MFIQAAAPSFKEKDRELIEWYRRQIAALPIHVEYHCEIKTLGELDADEIVIATGAKARKLRLPGIERSMEAIEYLDGKEVGENVVIIGGGLTGCEIAYDLFLKGKKPVIVEAKNDLMAVRGLCLANSSYLRDFFEHKKVPVYLESAVSKITADSAVIRKKDGRETTVPADDVIVSVGYTPAPLVKKRAHVHVVGDADKVGNLRTVIWQAWQVAEKL